MESKSSINTKFAVRLQVHKWTSWVIQNCHIFSTKRNNSATGEIQLQNLVGITV